MLYKFQSILFEQWNDDIISIYEAMLYNAMKVTSADINSLCFWEILKRNLLDSVFGNYFSKIINVL